MLASATMRPAERVEVVRGRMLVRKPDWGRVGEMARSASEMSQAEKVARVFRWAEMSSVVEGLLEDILGVVLYLWRKVVGSSGCLRM